MWNHAIVISLICEMMWKFTCKTMWIHMWIWIMWIFTREYKFTCEFGSCEFLHVNINSHVNLCKGRHKGTVTITAHANYFSNVLPNLPCQLSLWAKTRFQVEIPSFIAKFINLLRNSQGGLRTECFDWLPWVQGQSLLIRSLLTNRLGNSQMN